MKPAPLADQEMQLRAQRAELTLIIQGKRTLSIGELARREGLL